MLKDKLDHNNFIFIVFCILILIVIQNPLSIIQNSGAGSIWIQTSDVDFNEGNLRNVTISGIGSNTNLILYKEPDSWLKKSYSTKPSPRSGPSMAAFHGTDKFLLHGGWHITSFSNQTWIFDVSDDKWTFLNSLNNTPTERTLNAMAPIYGTDKIILFGGYNGAIRYNDTWIFDLSENNWTELNLPFSPIGSHGHSMSYIWGTDKILLFGGYNDISLNLDNTWTYDLSENTWTEHSISNKPDKRRAHETASIWGTDKILLFGGYDSFGQDRNETWIYDLSDDSWTNLNLNKNPSHRDYQSMTSIHGTDQVILFGGKGNSIQYDDTWIYDLSDNTWTKKILSPRPNKMHTSRIVNIYGTKVMVLFGGYDNSNVYGDTWFYDYNYYINGTYVSKKFDTSSSSIFKTLSWNASTKANTELGFQLRTAETELELNTKPFLGFDGTSSTFYSTSPSPIWEGHNSNRWVQIKAFLNTTDITATPTLEDISIMYNCIPETTSLSPSDGSVISINKPKFTWNFNDVDSLQQYAFQVLIDDNFNFSSIEFDSGTIITSDEFWQFPAGTSYTELPDGIWYWKVRTMDGDNDWGNYSEPLKFTIDVHAPVSAPTIPGNNMYYRSLDLIEGVASDPLSGTGVKYIEIIIQQLSNNYYWDGAEWSPLQHWLMTTGTTEWSYDSNNVDWNSDTQYVIRSRSTDNINNIEDPGIGITFFIDSEGPESTIDFPVNNTFLNAIDEISGEAFDKGGSGLQSAEVCIQRMSDSFYWNGVDWTYAETWNTANGLENWVYNTNNIIFSSDTIHFVRTRGIDMVNNIEKPDFGSTFMYDNLPPENLVCIINKGDEFTNSTNVILTIDGTDSGSGISQMAFSQDGSSWTEWADFNANLDFELNSGEGNKTIHYMARDRAGNTAEPVTGTIILDTITPTGSITINNGTATTNSTSVILYLGAEDETSGIGSMSFSSDGSTWNEWIPFSNEVSYELKPGEGMKTIFFRVKDNAGLISNSVSSMIELNTSTTDTEPDNGNGNGLKKDADDKSFNIQDNLLWIILILVIIIIIAALVIFKKKGTKETVHEVDVKPAPGGVIVAKPGTISAPTITLGVESSPDLSESGFKDPGKDIDLIPVDSTGSLPGSYDSTIQPETPDSQNIVEDVVPKMQLPPAKESAVNGTTKDVVEPPTQPEPIPDFGFNNDPKPIQEEFMDPDIGKEKVEKEFDFDKATVDLENAKAVQTPEEPSVLHDDDNSVFKPEVSSKTAESKEIIKQIEKLGDLKDKGLITEEEFVRKKEELLK